MQEEDGGGESGQGLCECLSGFATQDDGVSDDSEVATQTLLPFCDSVRPSIAIAKLPRIVLAPSFLPLARQPTTFSLTFVGKEAVEQRLRLQRRKIK